MMPGAAWSLDSGRLSSALAVCRFSPIQLVQVGPDICGHATQMQVFLGQPRQVLQPVEIVQHEPALNQRDQALTAKSLEYAVYMHRTQSHRIRDVELGQRQPDCGNIA